MTFDLSKVGIEKDLQYECITTTKSSDGIMKAGAFAFQYLGGDKVRCHIFEGSKTLKNIIDTNEYVVNITQDSMVFTYATLNCFDDEFFDDYEGLPIIKNSPAFIIVDVESVEIMSPENFPIKVDNNIHFITGKIRKLVINDETVRAFNRGMPALIESLVNVSRYKIVDEEKRKDYYDRLIENERVINKVSDDKTKKAMEIVKKEYDNS
jgi:hypothetical protein